MRCQQVVVTRRFKSTQKHTNAARLLDTFKGISYVLDPSGYTPFKPDSVSWTSPYNSLLQLLTRTDTTVQHAFADLLGVLHEGTFRRCLGSIEYNSRPLKSLWWAKLGHLHVMHRRSSHRCLLQWHPHSILTCINGRCTSSPLLGLSHRLGSKLPLRRNACSCHVPRLPLTASLNRHQPSTSSGAAPNAFATSVPFLVFAQWPSGQVYNCALYADV